MLNTHAIASRCVQAFIKRSRDQLAFRIARGAALLIAACILLLAIASTSPAAEPAEGLLLAESGQAKLPVVISAQASEQTKSVAAELAKYLDQITGAKFDVTNGDGSTGIVVGTLAEFPDPALEKPLEMRGQFDGKEAFALRTGTERLQLIGRTDIAVSHTANALLEELGCRWFFEAPEWEVVPRIATLRVNVNRDDRPATLARRIWYGGGLFENEPASRPVADYAAWARHNRMASSLRVFCSHAWQTIIAEKKEVFAQHPEYLALVVNKRHGEQLCVSNPALRALVVGWATDYFKTHPTADMVSLEPSDGGGQCECEACAKLGTISDRAFGLANEAARAVAKEHPGKLVGLYAYNEHSEPPAFVLEPNVYVQLTAGFTRGRYSFAELVELWPQKCKNMGFYEYFSVWPWDFDQLPGGRANDLRYLAKQIPLYLERRATSLDCESSGNWGLHGRGYYIANKLMWNPKADVDSLIADFYDKAFGPATAAMRRYYQRFDRGEHPLMSTHLLGLGFRDVEEATTLASSRPDIKARLNQVKQYLRSVHLRWLVDRALDKQKKKELTLAALTQGYRARYTYMNHWVGMRDAWANQAAVEFAEPSWAPSASSASQPWAVEAPYTQEEIDREFAEGIEFFQLDPVENKHFSSNLVAVDFSAGKQAATPAESVQAYQYTLPYALYSIHGESLALSVTAGTIPHYRDMAAATWTLTDESGKQLATDRLPLDGVSKLLELKVPSPGMYRFEFNDSMAGWQIKVPAGRPATLVLDRSRHVEHAGWLQPMYFYVPKATKQLHYFWSGQPHRVHGPDGTVLKEVQTNGDFVKVSVPEGADGQTWHFSQMMLGKLWLFNAPSYLAASPHALLVPKELAEKDGLKIVGPRVKTN